MISKTSFVDRSSLMLRLLTGAAFCLLFTQCGSHSTPVVRQIGDGTADVLTYHNDAARSGVQSKETILTPALVGQPSFGKVGSLAADGSVYAQPLVASNISGSDGTLHTMIVTATSHDTVFAYDAGSLQLLWSKSLLAAGEAPLSSDDVGSYDMLEIGITGTPVIDPATKTLYVVAKSKLAIAGQPTQYFTRIHALELKDGSEAPSSPAVIQAAVAGMAQEAVNGVLAFDPVRENQRSALLLKNGVVWVAFASHGDIQNYHGWLIGYDATSLAPTYVFNTTPNGYEGGIWSAGSGPAADDAGSLFVAVGNGLSDGYSCFGSSALRLTAEKGQVAVSDFYTPANQASLTDADQDFGIMGTVLLPRQSGSHPNLLVTGAKDGTLYVINRDQMGGFGNDQAIVQTFSIGAHLHQNGIFFNNTLFIGGDGSPLKAFSFNTPQETFSTTPASQTAHSFASTIGAWVTGTTPSASSYGATNGIIWAIDNAGQYDQPAVLYAFDPTNLNTVLYSSATLAADAPARAVKFTTPTIAYGRVLIGGYFAVTVYGQSK